MLTRNGFLLLGRNLGGLRIINAWMLHRANDYLLNIVRKITRNLESDFKEALLSSTCLWRKMSHSEDKENCSLFVGMRDDTLLCLIAGIQ